MVSFKGRIMEGITRATAGYVDPACKCTVAWDRASCEIRDVTDTASVVVGYATNLLSFLDWCQENGARIITLSGKLN